MSLILPTLPESMTPAEFVAWLRDFLALNEAVAETEGLSVSHVHGIRKHLALVGEAEK